MSVIFAESALSGNKKLLNENRLEVAFESPQAKLSPLFIGQFFSTRARLESGTAGSETVQFWTTTVVSGIIAGALI